MIRYPAYLLLVGIGLALQTTWLERTTIAGAIPDPLLIFILTVGLHHGPEEGALAGVGVGLLRDIVTGVPLGLGMLADMCVGFCAGLGQRFIYMESTWLPVIGGALLSGLRAAVWALAAHLVGLLREPVPDIARVVLAAACYNGIVAIPLFRAFRSLDRALARLHEEAR